MVFAIIRIAMAILLSGGGYAADTNRDAFIAHVGFVADMPADYAVAIYDGATAQGIDPLDLAAVCFTEVSGETWDLSIEGAARRKLRGERPIKYDNGKRGAAGEAGFCQVAPDWLSDARRDGLTEFVDVDAETLHANVQLSALLAAYVIRKAHESHAKHGDDSPKIGPHKWIAHYKCAPYSPTKPGSGRGYHCGTCGYGKRKFARARASIQSVASPRELLESHKQHWFRYCDGV